MSRKPYTKAERARREAKIVAGLDRMRTEYPEGFTHMMRVLARLVAKSRSKAGAA